MPPGRVHVEIQIRRVRMAPAVERDTSERERKQERKKEKRGPQRSSAPPTEEHLLRRSGRAYAYACAPAALVISKRTSRIDSPVRAPSLYGRMAFPSLGACAPASCRSGRAKRDGCPSTRTYIVRVLTAAPEGSGPPPPTPTPACLALRMPRLAHADVLPDADIDALVGEGACQSRGFCGQVG
ncbi:hypothetical protein K438DRAFT_1955602 [Mycena galopus ATCC 62051]|nr:hypothetical protein K438DRAFT_1955602 [Mycena galopus ATCC 62051]